MHVGIHKSSIISQIMEWICIMESEVHGAIYLLILERSSMDELGWKKRWRRNTRVESSRIESRCHTESPWSLSRGLLSSLLYRKDLCHGNETGPWRVRFRGCASFYLFHISVSEGMLRPDRDHGPVGEGHAHEGSLWLPCIWLAGSRLHPPPTPMSCEEIHIISFLPLLPPRSYADKEAIPTTECLNWAVATHRQLRQKKAHEALPSSPITFSSFNMLSRWENIQWCFWKHMTDASAVSVRALSPWLMALAGDLRNWL